MRISLLLLLSVLFISCNDDDNVDSNSVIGTWVINARLVDPGDGSGTFQPLSSGKTLIFSAVGSVAISKGTLCGISDDENGSQTGTYTSSTSRINISCEGFSEDFSVGYELVGGNLVVSYPCFEGCAERYSKVSD